MSAPASPVMSHPHQEQQHAKQQSLFWSQSQGLAIRTWHYSKRQRCINICNFILPPLTVVLLAVLNRVLSKDNSVIYDFQKNPRAAFAPAPIPPNECKNTLKTYSAASFNNTLQACLRNPFVPDFTIPYYTLPDIANTPLALAALGSANRSLAAVAANTPLTASGVLGSISLHPYFYPPLLQNKTAQRTDYDSVLFALLGSSFNPIYDAFVTTDQTPSGLDLAYHTSALHVANDKNTLDAHIYNLWFKGGAFPTYFTAYGFDTLAVSQGPTPTLSLAATIYYNESQTSASNCTVACPVVSAVERLDAAVYAFQTNGTRSASAYLRRMPKTKGKGPSFINLVLSIFLGILLHFFIPAFIGFLVYERKARLRELMTSMGMKASTYWLATYASLFSQYLLKIIIVIIVGIAVKSEFFTKNTFVYYFVLFFLWGNVVVAHAVLLSPFFSDPSSAVVFGWLYVILVNFVGGQYIGQLELSDNTSRATWFTIMLLPSFAFLRSIYIGGAFASGGKGVTLGSYIYKGHQLGMCRGKSPICTSYAYLIVQWIVMMVLGLYLDQVLPSASSVRRHPLFFLGYKREERTGKESKLKGGNAAPGIEDESQEPDDVSRERAQAKSAFESADRAQLRGVVVNELGKVYPGTRPPVHAVKDLSFVARANEVTGIIGGNGAGKSTTFRVMTGSIAPTTGNVLVDGRSVITDLRSVQSSMGVCFQQDILWNSLTLDEHLYFFARLRGVPKTELPDVVADALASVDLTFARRRRADECSGGMRRRLSVAIALLGRPSCCLLDEPTTGLDPQTRELVWRAIELAKHGRTVILTTHSMEEAQKLCDRIGLMSKGKLKCIGQPEELRLRLGRGYKLSMSAPESSTSAIHDLVLGISAESRVETALAGNLTYSIPRDVPASKIFATIASNRERLMISDWGLSQSSLEDVFLNVTRDETAIHDANSMPDNPDNKV